jgi:hypothetical protein
LPCIVMLCILVAQSLACIVMKDPYPSCHATTRWYSLASHWTTQNTHDNDLRVASLSVLAVVASNPPVGRRHHLTPHALYYPPILLPNFRSWLMSSGCHRLWLGDVQGLADHQAPMTNEQQCRQVKLVPRSHPYTATRHLIQDPSFAQPECHEC